MPYTLNSHRSYLERVVGSTQEKTLLRIFGTYFTIGTDGLTLQ
jgi:hypothetical protein